MDETQRAHRATIANLADAIESVCTRLDDESAQKRIRKAVGDITVAAAVPQQTPPNGELAG